MVKSDYLIKQGQTEISFPSSAGRTTTIVHPFLKGNYKTLFNPKNFKGDIRKPTGADYADFLHAVYCGPQEFRNSDEAKEARNNWFYVPIIKIWTPESFGERFGAYSVFDKDGVGRDFVFNQKELEKILDKTGKELKPGIILADGVSFAHSNTYFGGEHTSEELANDGNMITDYTPQGAGKLAEVSKKYNYKPHVLVVNNPTEPVKTVSALYGSSNRLDAYGDNVEDIDSARSFGVRRAP